MTTSDEIAPSPPSRTPRLGDSSQPLLRPGPKADTPRTPLPSRDALRDGARQADVRSGMEMLAILAFVAVGALFLVSIPTIGVAVLLFAPLCGGGGYLLIRK